MEDKMYKTAIVEIAKLADKYKAEDSKRGEMCREIERIIQDVICASSNEQNLKH